MALETGTYISDLVATNPTASDPASAGDDHLRLIKSTVKATFPNISGAVTPTHTELNYVDGVTSAIQTQINAISPSQTGNSGKLLTTNGTAAIWTDAPTLSSLSVTTLTASGTSTLGRVDADRITVDSSSVSGASINCLDGNYQYKTFSAGAISMSFLGVPSSGRGFRLTFEMTNAGVATITWPASVKWPGGAQPTWTSSGVDLVEFVTRDGGTTWRCINYQLDVK